MPDYHAHGYDGLTRAEMIAKMKKGWRSNETPCGTGSELRNAHHVRLALLDLAERYEIRSVADAGAGDLNWIPTVHWEMLPWHVRYRPFDLIPRHEAVTQLDITEEFLPESDLILCRHVLNHLSIRLAEKALAGFVASGSKYLLMTSCANQRDYWGQFGLSVPGELLETTLDCQHWDLEFYRLREE